MIRTGLLLFAVVALAQADSPADLGPTRIMSGSGGPLESGIAIYFATYVIPGGKWAAGYGGGGISVGRGVFHRDMKERTSGMYFGYDLTFTGDATNGYQAVFRPLSDVADRSRVIVPRLPPPQTIHDRDTIALDMMVSPDGAQRIVDYIQVFLTPPEPAAATTSAEPRDFIVDDGAVTYNSSFMTFWINGQKQSGLTGFTGKPGASFWVAFPGRGRYILSLVPYDGFSKSGIVRDNVLSFQDGGQEYEVRLMSPIAGSGKAWNLYVLHDAGYEGKPQLRDAISCGSDRLENLVSGR